MRHCRKQPAFLGALQARAYRQKRIDKIDDADSNNAFDSPASAAYAQFSLVLKARLRRWPHRDRRRMCWHGAPRRMQ
jgi:hypothetical protein